MPKQSLDVLDYFGPLAAALVFASILLLLSITLLLWCLVTPNDDKTVFAKWGLGPRARHDQQSSEPIVKAD